MQISEIRKVTLYWLEGTPTSYFIPADQVATFVEASKRLHWRPGKNPHNGEEASKIWRIASASLEARGPFWWTVPDLQNNGDPRGAQIIDGGIEVTVFQDEEYVAKMHAEEAEQEAEYYRERERAARAASAAL